MTHRTTSPARNGKVRAAIWKGLAQLVWRKVADLKLQAWNPRKHTKKQIRQIAKSIQAFRFNVPILIDRNLDVIAGHGRILACRLLGITEVPTICLEHLNESQIRAFMIADNKLTENSAWDDRLLAEQFKELSLVDLEFDLEATGFEMGEIDLRIESLSADGPDTEDTTPVQILGPAVSRLGDVYDLDEHRISCGDALDPAVFRTLLGNERAAMSFNDPPYNLKIEGHVSGFGKIHHPEFAMAHGEMSDDEFTNFLTNVFTLLVRYSKAGSIHFAFSDWRHLLQMLTAGLAVYTAYETFAYGQKKPQAWALFIEARTNWCSCSRAVKHPHRNNVQLGVFGRNRTNLWRYPGAVGLRTSEEGNLLRSHPTPKPVPLVADAMLDCSARGDIVLDSFLGSGSSVIAAEKTGRRCFGIEIEPLYVDCAIRRWQSLTGRQAINSFNGRSFEELARETQKGHG
jgi:DNA modification methylase